MSHNTSYNSTLHNRSFQPDQLISYIHEEVQASTGSGEYDFTPKQIIDEEEQNAYYSNLSDLQRSAQGSNSGKHSVNPKKQKYLIHN